MALKDNPLYQISEKDFQSEVVKNATKLGWRWWHVSDARMAVGGKLIPDPRVAGLPDLILVHRGRGFIFAELKKESRSESKLRPKQIEALEVMGPAAMLTAMTGCRVRVHVWRPSDMDTMIVPLLRTGKGPTTYGF